MAGHVLLARVVMEGASSLAPVSELDFTLTLPAAMTAGTDVFVQARGRDVRMEPRTEEGAERVGIGAIIEAYEFVRAKPRSA